jgi:Flp pilus assembly protein, pilin Flp
MHRFTKLTTFIATRAKCLARDESGATAIEYALIASGISIVIVAAVNSLGTTINNLFFERIATAMK